MKADIRTDALEYAFAALVKSLHQKQLVNIDDITHEITTAAAVLNNKGKTDLSAALLNYNDSLRLLCED